MGSWGEDVFENDDAGDWVYDLEKNGIDYVSTTLASVTTCNDYLDAGTACEGLAAAEAVARMLGRPGQNDAYTESLDAWLSSNGIKPSPELVEAAVATVDRVLADNSELVELWEDAGDSDGWRTCVDGLRQRLASS